MSNSNDKKIAEYRKNKIFKYMVVFMLIGVIILELLAIFNVISMIWGAVLFIIIYLFEKIILK